MKKIFFVVLFSIISIGVYAQFPGIETHPVCWDSSGVKKIQLYSVVYVSFTNTNNFYKGYYDRQGNLTSVVEAEISDGFCDLNEINRNTDTLVNVTCMLLTRQITNTVNSQTLYPKHQLEKHTISVGGQVIETKYYEPHDMQLVESGVLDISVMGCEDFYVLDFQSMNFHSDTMTVNSGDTTTITISGYASSFEIVCDKDNMDMVQLDITYSNVQIDAAGQTVAGNKRVILATYVPSFYQKWEFQRFDSIDVIAIGANCKCTYAYSHEYQKF